MRQNDEYIIGSGGGGSDQPSEVDDNLKSTPYARLLMVTGEGQIGGAIGGAQSIYFDDVVLQNPDGTFNFQGVDWYERVGLPDQDAIKGFTETESVITFANREITTMDAQAQTVPWDVDSVKIVIMIPSLLRSQKDGDIKRNYLDFEIQTKSASDATWTTVLHPDFYGKTRSPVQIQYRVGRPLSVDLTTQESWMYRIVRNSPDETSEKNQNRTFLSAHVELREQTTTYPNSSLLALVANLEQFGNRIPKATVDLEGLYVPVPVNYTEVNGIPHYEGVWDGRLNHRPTSNPIWHLRNLIVESLNEGASNKRYSLGLPESAIDDAELYAAARYCDAVDANGNFVGVTAADPDTGVPQQIRRFTVNTVIAAPRPAFEWISTLAATARAAVYVAGGVVRLAQDRPQSPVAQFTNANVENGRFVRSSASKADRITRCNVTFNDPADNYKQAIASFEDTAAVERFGLNEANITIYSTSHAEAWMLAKWTVQTSLLETHQLKFRAGLDAGDLLPGQVISTLDQHFALPGSQGAKRRAGRILGGTDTTVEVDAPVEIESTDSTYTLTITNADGTGFETRNITNLAGTHNTLSVDTPFTDPVQRGHVYVVGSQQIQPQQWRVLAKRQVERMVFEIEAMEYRPEKYDFVEQDVIAPPTSYQKPYTSTIATPVAPTLTKRSRLDTFGRQQLDLVIAWDDVDGAVHYRVNYRVDGADTEIVTTTISEATLKGINAGFYEVTVQAINATGTTSMHSPKSTIELTLDETTTLVAPLNLRTNLGGTEWSGQNLTVLWDHNAQNDENTTDFLSSYAVTIKDPDGTVLRTTTVPSTATSYSYSWSDNTVDGGPRRTLTVEVAAADVQGAKSAPIALTATNNPPAVPTGLTLTPLTEAYRVAFDTPADPDWRGIVVHHDTVDGFVPSAGNQAAVGVGTQVDVEATGGQLYYVKVAAYDGFGIYDLLFSASSTVTANSAGYVVPETPTALTVRSESSQVGNVDQHVLIVEFNSVAGAQGYEVGITPIEGGIAGSETVHPTTSTHFEKQVLPETTYEVRVRSVNVEKYSPWSAPVQHTTGADTSIVRVHQGYWEPLSIAIGATWVEVAAVEIDTFEQPVSGHLGAHVVLEVPATAGLYLVDAQIKKDSVIIRGPIGVLTGRSEGTAWTAQTYVTLPMDDPSIGIGPHRYSLELRCATSTASADERLGWMSS